MDQYTKIAMEQTNIQDYSKQITNDKTHMS